MPEVQGQTDGVGPAPIPQATNPEPATYPSVYLAPVPDAPASPAPDFRTQINVNKNTHDLNLRRLAYALSRLIDSWPASFAITPSDIIAGGLHYVTFNAPWEGFVGSYVTIEAGRNVSVYDSETNRIYARQDGIVTVLNSTDPAVPQDTDIHGEYLLICICTTDAAGNVTITDLRSRLVGEAWSKINWISGVAGTKTYPAVPGDMFFNRTDKYLYILVDDVPNPTWWKTGPFIAG